MNTKSLLFLSFVIMSSGPLGAAATQPTTKPSENQGAARQGAAAAQTPAQAQGLLKSLKDIQVLVKGIQDIGGIVLTLFSFGDLAQGLNKTTNPLFAIIDEFNKETPDINKVMQKLHEMEAAQPLILKDAERIVKVLVSPVSLFSPIVVKALRKQGKVTTKNGIEMVEIQKCITKEVVEKVTKEGKLVDEKRQIIETTTQEVPVKDAAKYIADFTVCQIFKLLNSYHQAVETMLHKYLEMKDALEKTMVETKVTTTQGA